MNLFSTASALAKLSDEELVERVAGEVMHYEVSHPNGKLMVNIPWDLEGLPEGCGVSTWTEDWNPLNNWNHWREVEEKIMEDEKTWNSFLLRFDPRPHQRSIVKPYMKSDLRTRCICALLSVS